MKSWKSVSLWIALLLLAALTTACGSRTIVDDSTKETGLQSSLVVSPAGAPLIAYFDKTNRMIKLAVCNDARCNEPAIHTIDDEGATGQYPSLVLNDAGHPVVSYYDMSKKVLKLATCEDPACDSVQRMAFEDADSDKFGEYSALQLDGQGLPVISYYDARNRHLKLIRCADALCQDYTVVLVDDGEKVGKATSLVLKDGDVPVISYFDEENGYLKVAICQDALCGDPVLRVFVSDEAEAGEYNAIALNAQGHPLISYSYHDTAAEPQVGALKLVVCQDPLCEGATSTTVDERRGGLVGEYNAMVLNSEGFPVIAYWDAGNRAVKVARCRDAACNRTRTQQAKFDWGLQFIAVALDENDNAYVSCHEVRPNRKRLVLLQP